MLCRTVVALWNLPCREDRGIASIEHCRSKLLCARAEQPMFPQPSGARRCRIRTGCADAGTFPRLAWLDAPAEVASDAVGAPSVGSECVYLHVLYPRHLVVVPLSQ